MSYTFANEHVDCIVEINEGNQMQLHGTIKTFAEFDSVEIIAPNPIDRRMSYTGSGLPFPCAAIAFEKTPNYKKLMKEDNGIFRLFFMYPNSYYTEDGFTRIPPSIFFILRKNDDKPIFIRFELPMDPLLNMRTLTYRNLPRQGPHVYNMKENVVGICGAEETMLRYMKAKIFNDLA